MNTEKILSTLYILNFKQMALGLIVLLFGFGLLAATAPTVLAIEDGSNIACQGTTGNLPQPGVECDPDGEAGKTLEATIDKILQWFFWVVGITSVIMLIFGGLRYAVSGGNAEGVKAARNTIIYALIGLVIASLAGTIATFVIKDFGG